MLDMTELEQAARAGAMALIVNTPHNPTAKVFTADELAAVIRDAIAGNLEDNAAAQEWEAGAYPGSEHGLSPRESDVLGLVTQGLSNQEIAETLYLSINSVKTYIRSTYRKMGVATRSQAVLWAIQHGFPAPELPDSPTDIEGVAP